MAYIIGISGGSGSGKTTFLHALRSQFLETELCILSQDNYYLPIDQIDVDENSVHNFDLPNAFDHQAFLNDLQKLKIGQTVKIQEYTFNNPHLISKPLIIQPASVIVAEGIFLFHEPEVWDQLNLKIIIEAKDRLKIIRRIRRDSIERDYDMEDVIYRYENHVGPAYDQFIAPFIEKVDLIIQNNHSFENALAVVTGFIRNKLLEH